jgi:ferrochelatase
MTYTAEYNFQHGRTAKLGILLTNLGTPDAPTKKALKSYLAEFLWDPRIVEPPPPRAVWWMILHGIILNLRPKVKAHDYETIWGQFGPGSPLLDITEAQAAGIRKQLAQRFPDSPIEVAIAMRYGNPSMAAGLDELRQKGCERLLILPLYPQYAAATTGSTWDALADALKQWRRIPDVRFISHYHKDAGYINALANSVQEYWGIHGKPDKLLMSFHGIPQRYLDNGDSYHCECHATGRLLAEALELKKDDYIVSFQSLFGKEEWIKPYTDATIKSLPAQGIKNLHVICPGFSADCLETVEEIDAENRGYFMEAGGESYHYIPALNSREDHLIALTDILEAHGQGWPEMQKTFDAATMQAENKAIRERARAMGCPF